ncbi:MAG: DUF3017 domain-containing protein [Candidatus Nanopelagicales bacterium]
MSTASGDEYLVADASPRMGTVEVPAPDVTASRSVRWPSLVVFMFALAGLVLIAVGSLHDGLIALTLSLALASVMRLLLPGPPAEWLSSRSRVTDGALLAALAASLGAVALLLFK